MYRFLFVTLVAAVMADPHEGPCPEVKLVENFNLTAYQGVWYEISKIPIESQGKGQCAQAEYTLEGDVVKVKNTHVINGVQTSITGTAKAASDAKDAGKFIVSFTFGEHVTESPLLILATDYTGYAIPYNCRYDEKTKTHKEQAWVLSRSKKLEGAPKTAVDTFLKEHSKIIDASKLVPTDLSEEACKFTSTGVMTTPVAKP